jgi:lipopolysaccharide biosynthesis regulator YciM
MNFEFLLVVFLLLLIFAYVGWVVKRFWIDKKSVSLNTQFMADKMLSDWMNEDKRRAVELVRHIKEEKQEEDEKGEGNNKE